MAQVTEQEAPAASQDMVDEAVEKIRARVEELRPMNEEYEKGRRFLALVDSKEEVAPSSTEAPVRTRQTSDGDGGGTRRGQRYEEFMTAVREHPGSTVAELAKILGVDPPNYLYRIASNAIKKGEVTRNKDGRFTPAPA